MEARRFTDMGTPKAAPAPAPNLGTAKAAPEPPRAPPPRGLIIDQVEAAAETARFRARLAALERRLDPEAGSARALSEYSLLLFCLR